MSSAKTIAGRVLLIAILVWSIGSLCVWASFLWTPRGTIGLTTNYGGLVTAVTPGSPADRMLVVVGDRIDLAQTPFESRPKLIGTTTPFPPGTVIPFALDDRGSVRILTLTATTAVMDPVERVSLLLSSLCDAIFIIVSASLIFLRPSRVTWGFGLFCLLINPVVPSLAQFPSATAHLWYVCVYDVVQNIGLIGLLTFAITFPNELNIGWRARLARLFPAIFVLLAAWTLAVDLCVCVFAVPANILNVSLQVAFGLVDLLTIVIISETYLRGPTQNRPRLRWVMVGFYVGLIGSYIGTTLIYTANVVLPEWFDAILVSTEVTLPLAVAYAIVRHRVIEIDIFFSRALVYALFTFLLIVVFGTVDWVFSRLLADFRLSLVFDAAISVGIAIVFDRVQKLLEALAERIVFRARRVANERLDHTSQTFAFVTEAAHLDETIVRELSQAFGIASVALLRHDDEVYRPVATSGWHQAAPTLGADDRLVLEHLRIAGRMLYLADIPWNRNDLPHGAAQPVISVPLRSADELRGLLLLGHRRNGESIDAEERRRLLEFANRAAVAYDRLDTEELRRDADELRARIAVLEGRLDEARRAH